MSPSTGMARAMPTAAVRDPYTNVSTGRPTSMQEAVPTAWKLRRARRRMLEWLIDNPGEARGPELEVVRRWYQWRGFLKSRDGGAG